KAQLARKLVDSLNADQYAVRVKAREGLIRLGRASIEPLEYAMHAEDSETRLRAIELLVMLRGRGLLGVAMTQPQIEWGAGVQLAQPGMPAEQAGVQSGDIILALN